MFRVSRVGYGSVFGGRLFFFYENGNKEGRLNGGRFEFEGKML